MAPTSIQLLGLLTIIYGLGMILPLAVQGPEWIGAEVRGRVRGEILDLCNQSLESGTPEGLRCKDRERASVTNFWF